MENYELWETDLTEEETEELIENLAEQIRKRKLESPSILFLEMHKPISRIAGNALVVFSPFVAPFVGIQNVSNYSQLLTQPGAVERLIVKLEESAIEQSSKNHEVGSN